MPRLARKNIETEYIHVMVQGVNKEYIFDDRKHLLTYLKLIKENIKPESFSLIAYCMMSNHAHFLFYVCDIISFEKYMHKINQHFAQIYNYDKNRVGVVFRNRYRVEPVCSEEYIINCINYIHDNPVEARMVERREDYPYSSFREYLNKTGVSQNEIVKRLVNYEFICSQPVETMTKRIFMDVEEANNNNCILSGIKIFMKKYNKNWIDIFCNRKTLRHLLIFLKNICNASYRDVGKYLEIPNNSLKYNLKERS